MFVDFLLDVFGRHRHRDAIVWRDEACSYSWLLDRVRHWREALADNGVAQGSVVVLEADFSPNSIALFLAAIDRRCILVPLTNSVAARKAEFMDIAQAEVAFVVTDDDQCDMRALDRAAEHKLYRKLREVGHPGLVLFSSGSTGRSKAAVHDFVPLLKKFHVAGRRLRTITFLLYDHIGGVNTTLYTLSNGGCIVVPSDRSPDGVLSAIEKHDVELLPTSPTFVNLILLDEAYERYELKSLKLLTYGTEPMLESTLQRFNDAYPHVKLQQTYGLSEVGIMRSKSRDSRSLWVRVGGRGFETRVKGGTLHVKAESAMLGYLNAPSPFTRDGWMNTQDRVQVDGKYVRFLGRTSEIINVGGQKVYPAEVESVIQEMDQVAEASVYGEKNPITGQIVCARVTPHGEADAKHLARAVKKHCSERMDNFKVPLKVKLVPEGQHSRRFKKVRPGDT